jgi:hypothetical protein
VLKNDVMEVPNTNGNSNRIKLLIFQLMKQLRYVLMFFLFLLVLTFLLRHNVPAIGNVYYNFQCQVLNNRLTRFLNISIAKPNEWCPKCEFNFTDNVSQHKKAYYLEGIQPQKNNQRLNRLYTKGVLKKLESNNYFYIRDLNYSYPYLLPEAQKFIFNLCKMYSDSCANNHLDYVPITITSITRTIESVERLKMNNRNAISESAHLRGKTFDISYTAFGCNTKQFKMLSDILVQCRRENQCFVKYETNGCLHITVN